MKTRSYKELFKLMLDTEHKRFSGLCILVSYLHGVNIITPDENDKLKDYIIKHRPAKGKHYDKIYNDGIYQRAYYWPEHKWEPRDAWLLDQIKKLN